MDKQAEKCPICYHRSFTPFFEICDVPTQDGVLLNTKQDALDAPKGNIRLAFCLDCGYIGNLLFKPHNIKYDQDYSFSLHYSPTYQEFINNLLSRLINTYNLREKTILEIGCGQGDFLRLFCEMGNNHGIGIDPSIPSRIEMVGSKQIVFYTDLYSDKYSNLDCDSICCRQVLDQLADPRGFLETVRRNIGDNRDKVVYFEVPNAVNIFEDMLIRNIIYEKSSWFTGFSLSRLFEIAGFEVLSIESCFESGQYLGIEARPSQGGGLEKVFDISEVDSFRESINSFSNKYNEKIRTWYEQLSSLQQSGKRVIAWGSGSGAINYFCALTVKDEIPYVIDINPLRQGKYLPLTGQEVVPPDFIREYSADIVVITNATYEQEIKQEVQRMGIDCEFWTI